MEKIRKFNFWSCSNKICLSFALCMHLINQIVNDLYRKYRDTHSYFFFFSKIWPEVQASWILWKSSMKYQSVHWCQSIKGQGKTIGINIGTDADFFIYNSDMTWFFSPIKSTDTNWALFTYNVQFPIQPVVTGFSEKRRSENRFWCLFSGSLWWSWVTIRIEIKMKSWVSLSSNLPRVIDRSNLLPYRFAARW